DQGAVTVRRVVATRGVLVESLVTCRGVGVPYGVGAKGKVAVRCVEVPCGDGDKRTVTRCGIVHLCLGSNGNEPQGSHKSGKAEPSEKRFVQMGVQGILLIGSEEPE